MRVPLGVAAAAATGDAIPYPNIGLVVESDLCDGDGAVYSAADVIAPGHHRLLSDRRGGGQQAHRQGFLQGQD